jgi:hypothetical protein
MEKMRWSLFVMALVSSTMLAAQPSSGIKKKYLGTYVGELPAYTFVLGTENVPVSACGISITLEQGKCVIQLGNQRMRGSWKLVYQTDQAYFIEATHPGHILPERLQLNKKTSRILREGVLHQPDAVLDRERN